MLCTFCSLVLVVVVAVAVLSLLFSASSAVKSFCCFCFFDVFVASPVMHPFTRGIRRFALASHATTKTQLAPR